MATDLVLFHSALGLRPSVLEFADRLREVGHTVHTPDLFEGAIFEDVEEGARRRDEIGIEQLLARAGAAVADFPSDVVFAGFSMGTGAAQVLAATRPGVRGLILMHGALAPAAIGVPRWPAVPVQIHYGLADPEVEVGDVRALEAAARDAGVLAEVYGYPGCGHLFEDPRLPGHDPAATKQMVERVAAFVERLPAATHGAR